jgi:hypothetical protein
MMILWMTFMGTPSSRGFEKCWEIKIFRFPRVCGSLTQKPNEGKISKEEMTVVFSAASSLLI